ncbi:FAD-dependent oxidoreductase [Agitococcus lubricus]|uniref:Putative NAD/FAD-binding protein n=1 Tax=Agitococcus lubricus TaxID=1077255 RepID=A0A2T5J206_9GAMM|nr:FAD-dependent oxidoreductase [Agitococcus lubricus]PTQ90438.1 putative NAD/FAD-binding protein [Agitococcus lubricus]
MSKKIAIIGSGIAGLTAAYRARQAGFEVTVFEAQHGHGMDAHCLDVDGGRVDVPLRVMNPKRWQHVLRLASEVGVNTFAVDTYVSCSNLQQQTWFRSTRLPLVRWPMLASWRFLHRNSAKIAYGLYQLRQLLAYSQQTPQQSIAELLVHHPIDPIFWRGLVLPLLTTICTCDEAHLLAWPSHQLLSLLDDILHAQGKRLLRLEGGTSALVRALAVGIACCHGSPVVQVMEQDTLVWVQNQRGEGGWFDRVIIATQANQLHFLTGEHYALERALLAAIPYAQGELVVHQDLRCLPRHRHDWTALNFQADTHFERFMFSVWVNAVEPTLANQAPVLQTWNPMIDLDESKVISRTRFQRAVVNQQTTSMLAQLTRWHRQANRKVFYIGSWAYEGVPLLESAVCSAEAVIRLLQESTDSHVVV